jgi:hypothetical protein
MRMGCPECGAELAGTATADVTVTGRDGTQLRIGAYGISFRHKSPDGSTVTRHWTLIDRGEVHWLRDGPRKSRRPKWSMEIVLTDGTAVTAQASASKTESADPEVLETIKRAARAHGIPTALTGKPTARMPSNRFPAAGLFPNPATEPGLREWTGTEWSDLVHLDQADGPLCGELAAGWSALSRDQQQRHWEDADRRLSLQRARLYANETWAVVSATGLIACCAAAAAVFTSATSVGSQVAVCVTDLVFGLCTAVFARGSRRAGRSVRRHARIVEVARQAALRAGLHDMPSTPDRTWVVSGRRGSELRMDEHEITVREGGRTRWIGWDEVRWFRDGHCLRPSLRRRARGWGLAIVLKDGNVVTPAATKMRGHRSREAIEKAGQASRQHAIPAVLTGTPAREWTHQKPKPWGSGRLVDKPGCYVDPGGELGLREWTGAEWLPALHVAPSTGPEGADGPVIVRSPLPGAVQRQLWAEAVTAVPRRRMVALETLAMAGVFAGPLGVLYWPLVYLTLGKGPALAAAGYAGIALLTCAGARLAGQPVRNARAARKAARPARTALAESRASAKV